MKTETRAGGELRALGGRKVAGVLLRYSDTARLPDGRSERFLRGSLDPLPETLPVNVQHDPAMVAGTLTLSGDGEAILAAGEVSPGAHDLIRRGALGGLSVEFRALAEREEAAPLHGRAVRVIERGKLLGAGLVDRPAYPLSGVEARNLNLRGSYRTTIRPDRAMDCRCSGSIPGKTTDVTISRIQFNEKAWEPMMEAIRNETRDVLAISRGAGDVVATTGTGSLGLSVTGGALAISVAPLDTEAGRRTRELVEAGVPVYARPVIDFSESEYETGGDTAVIRRADFRYILLKPTDRTGGLEPLRKGREGRTLSMRRRFLIAGAA